MRPLLASDGMRIAVDLSVPWWFLWGIVISLIILLGVTLAAFIITAALGAFTMGFLGGDSTLRSTFAYSMYCLLPAMGGSYIGSSFGRAWGWLAGAMLFVAVWLSLSLIERRKRRSM